MGPDLSSPKGASLKWEWVKIGHIFFFFFWLMLLMDTIPDQIPQAVGARAAPKSSHVNTDVFSR